MKWGASAGNRRRRNRVDVQVFLMTGLLVVLSCGVIFAVCYFLTYDNMVEELQTRAESLHQLLEDRLDGASFSALTVREDERKEVYERSRQMLEYARSSAGVRYLYTAKRTEAGAFVYLVDGLPADSGDFRDVGDPIEPECVPDMERALSGETVLPESIAATTRGHVFTAYFPMHENGRAVGVLGIEFEAGHQYLTLRNICIATLAVVALVCLTAALAAVLLFRRISNPSYKDLANTDFLTGLKNRNAFSVDLENLERRLTRSRGTLKPALVSIDLDGLKQVNDAGGHDVGDRYIQAAARLMASGMYHPEALYRTGGDEFAALLPEACKEELEALFHKLRQRQEDTPGIPEVRLSAGCAVFDPGLDENLTDTFRRADEEMYRRKREKKGLT